MQLQTPLFAAILLLLCLPVQLHVVPVPLPSCPHAMTSSSLCRYRLTLDQFKEYFDREGDVAERTSQRIQEAYQKFSSSIRELINKTMADELWLRLVKVMKVAEEAWMDAQRRGILSNVSHCIDTAEANAHQVMLRTLEKARACAEQVDLEGQRRTRMAQDIVSTIRGIIIDKMHLMQKCVEEAKVRATTEAPPAPQESPVPEEPLPAALISTEETSPRCTHTKNEDGGAAETQNPCSGCSRLCKRKCRNAGEMKISQDQLEKAEYTNKDNLEGYPERKKMWKDGRMEEVKNEKNTENVSEEEVQRPCNCKKSPKRQELNVEKENINAEEQGSIKFGKKTHDDENGLLEEDDVLEEKQHVHSCMLDEVYREGLDKKIKFEQRLQVLLERIPLGFEKHAACVATPLSVGELKMVAIEERLKSCTMRFLEEVD